MLELVDVRSGYGRSEVIHGVNLEVPSDGVAAVMGHNGAGKTTLLRVAVGLLKCSGGKVMFDGEDVTKMRPSARVARERHRRSRSCRSRSASAEVSSCRWRPTTGTPTARRASPAPAAGGRSAPIA